MDVSTTTINKWFVLPEAECIPLAVKLAYLPEQRLRGLNEFCIRMARGRRHDVWPKEQHVLNWAYRIQPPPAERSEYVCRILRSAMGRRALDEGYHVELFETANRWGPPPTKYDISKMKWQAEENCSKRARVLRENQRGVARQDDLQWLRWFTALAPHDDGLVDLPVVLKAWPPTSSLYQTRSTEILGSSMKDFSPPSFRYCTSPVFSCP